MLPWILGAAGVATLFWIDANLIGIGLDRINPLTPSQADRDKADAASLAALKALPRRTAIPGTSGGLGGSILVDDDVLIAPGQFFNPQFPPPGVDTITPVLSRVLEPVGNMTPLGIPSILVRPLDSRVQSGLGHMVPLSSVLLVSRR